MNNNGVYIAHIADDGRIQSVKEHLTGTSDLCSSFSKAFDATEIGRKIGLLHDIGKYSEAFQSKIRGKTISVDHSTAGAYECGLHGDKHAAFCIAGHHGGIPNLGGAGDISGKNTLKSRIEKAHKGNIEPYDKWKDEISYPLLIKEPYLAFGKTDTQFFIRMLFSCLVDADFLDTERFMNDKSREHSYDDIEQLITYLEKHIESWGTPRNHLNQVRSLILNSCIESGRKSEMGLFSLTVPTGGGKTISSLAFALEHAKRHSLKRIIYVIPYTSIIEQTADVFKGILGINNVLEHHSGILIEDDDYSTNNSSVQLKLATENWDMPIIVTTSVQFFESLYSNKTSKCRKLHNIAESVVIFDEAQMLPLSCIQPCVQAIDQLVRHYHVSAVLCTATQPALTDVFKTIRLNVKKEMNIDNVEVDINEICPEYLQKDLVFKRANIQFIGNHRWGELADILSEKLQALCIVNTRKNAQHLYELIPDKNGLFHLSTMMYPEHRREVLKEIRCRLKAGERCIVIATSLIEAGVDVDFPVVYRELAGIDSIIQAAGRCNREGKRNPDESIVSIFKSESPIPPAFEIYVKITEQVLQKYPEINTAEAITFYFQQLRAQLSSSQAQDVCGIMKMGFEFERIAESFHLIESNTYTVYIPDDKCIDLLNQYRHGVKSKSLFRKMSQFGVSIYLWELDKLKKAGAIECLDEDTTNAYILINTLQYSNSIGLKVDLEDGDAFFI